VRRWPAVALGVVLFDFPFDGLGASFDGRGKAR
jgi:hypothetical protein